MANINEILSQYQNEDSETENNEVEKEVTQPEVEEKEVKEEKPLSQKDIDKIVEDRLKRERKKYEDYNDLKEIAESLKTYGYSGTTAEIKAQIKLATDTARKEKELESLQEEAELKGTTPELLQELKEVKRELADLKKEKTEAEEKVKKEQKQKELETEEFNRMTQEFQTEFPDVNITDLARNKKFTKFASRSNPNLSLVEVYQDYLEFVGETEAETISKIQSKENRSTNSGRKQASADGGTYGLTATQQQLARENKMTYKEYSSLLSHIKK